MTSGYVISTTERLREPAQRICDRLRQLCGIDFPASGNVAKLKISWVARLKNIPEQPFPLYFPRGLL